MYKYKTSNLKEHKKITAKFRGLEKLLNAIFHAIFAEICTVIVVHKNMQNLRETLASWIYARRSTSPHY